MARGLSLATRSSNSQLGVQGVPGVDGSESLMLGESSNRCRPGLTSSTRVLYAAAVQSSAKKGDLINAQPRKLETPNYNYNIQPSKAEIRTCNSTKTQCLIKKRRANILRPRDISGIFMFYTPDAFSRDQRLKNLDPAPCQHGHPNSITCLTPLG